MDAAILSLPPHSALLCPAVATTVSSLRPRFIKPIFPFKDITDASAPSRVNIHQQTVTCTRSEGNRRGRTPRRNTPSGKLPKRNDSDIPQPSNGKSSNSSNQEEIIALFRRIQSSISRRDSQGTKYRSSNASEGKASAESVLDILRQSRKQLEEGTPNGGGATASTWRRGAPTKEHRMHDAVPAVGFKLTRPPSSFSRRSPIPSLLGSRTVEQATEASSGTVGGHDSQRVEEMKLHELKELAKSRGIKGYSKLKKSQLVEVLMI